MRKNGKTAKFFSWYTLTAVAAAAVLSALGGIWLHGMPLTGLPKAEDVEAVTVTRGQQQVELTAPDDVLLLAGAANLLSYKPFSAAEDAPVLTVTYRLKNGDTRTVEASAASVWWNGRAHAVHEPGMFVNIVGTLYLDGPGTE
ncbi:MAG: hypothetical protein HDT26_11770 [Subdoligranulum sp.]|nr:hypothetical protein [Subdoligranulum sp.]